MIGGFIQDEKYPLRLIQHELTKRNFDFIIEWGVRMLFSNGDFFGVTTTEVWNDFVKKQQAINQSKQHYLTELSNVLQRNMKYVIRNKEFANNPFLLSLAEAEVCNGLGIYTINHVGIAGYFFTARHDNKEAINFFINHLHLFVKIVNKVDKQLIRTGYWNNVNISTNNQKLFNIDDRRFIFGNKQLKNYSPLKIFLDEKEVQLTSRQVQTLDALKNISTTNDLANFLNTTSRTAEWHLSEIRKRTGLKGRSELIDFAMMYIK